VLLSIIIPIYNEESFIDMVIKKINSARLSGNIHKEIILINDGSTDQTNKRLQQYNNDPAIKIFHQDTNKGKTAAVKLGIQQSQGDIILIQDADLEYDPDDYQALLEPIITSRARVVYGSRFKGTIDNMSLINRFANIISNMTFNFLFRTRLTDINTCYKVFKKEVLKDPAITSKRKFTFDTEITAKLVQWGYTIYEVPIRYVARSKQEGKKITWKDALEMYWAIIQYGVALHEKDYSFNAKSAMLAPVTNKTK